MSSSSQQSSEKVALLKEVTGIEDDDVATFLLSKNNWDIQHAVQEYLSGEPTLASSPPALVSASSPAGQSHVRRRSTSPGTERRVRAHQQQWLQARRDGKDAEVEESMGGSAGGGGEGDEAPLLGLRGGGEGNGEERVGAGSMEMEQGGRNGARGGGASLPFYLVGNVLHTLLAPVRYIAGVGEGMEGETQNPKEAAEAFIKNYEKEYHCAGVEGGGGGEVEGREGAGEIGEGGGYAWTPRPRPRFLPLSFQDATRLASREGKLLLVYVHAPLHEHTPAFVQRVLNTDPIVSFLDGNMLVWGGSVHSADACQTAQILDAAAFPFIALVACQRHPHLSVLEHMEGVTADIGPEAILQRLTAAMARLQAAMEQQQAVVREREERSRLQAEQNREYQEALEADRRREAALVAEKARAVQEAEAAQRRAEEEREEEEKKRVVYAQCIAEKQSRLPPEPAPGSPGALRLRLQFPHGKKLDRRFRPTDSIQIVRDFIDVQVAEEEKGGKEEGCRLVNYSLSTPFPKRTFGEVGMTLQEVGLHSADTIYITDLDA
ncbi:UBX domain-containing protein [Nannochloropsis gaditana]|uniref:UBX domain-containing protein n=1 Tax=Nannochloropsis gaditana TaxID=72520 RepID=W7TQI1_9STRA|nr:UBX domain-containing protein [Nannochloropsis gaditana]